MDFKQYFLYQTDYQHWANDQLFNALDRLNNEARISPQKLFFGNAHNHLDHLAFFYRKWLQRLQGSETVMHYTGTTHADWRELKNALRQEIRTLQHWLEKQPQDFYDSRISYRRSLNQDHRQIWVRDALTHIFTYGATERGHVAAIAATMGAPFAVMDYYSYRTEMGEHLENLRKAESGSAID